MAKAVSTETFRPGNRTGQGSWPPDPKPVGCCSALRAFHALLDPVVGIDAGRRVHAFGGEAHDIDDLGFVLLLVETIGAISGSRDTLVPIADGELDLARGAFELDTLERRRHLVGSRL